MESNKIEVSYYRPTLTRRLFSRIVDGFLVCLLSLICFVSINSIYSSIPKYNEVRNNLDEIRLNSSLYTKKTDDTIINVSTFIYQDKKMSDSKKEEYLLLHLDNFFNYLKNYNEKSYLKAKNSYDEFRLKDSLKYNNCPLFIKDDQNNIIKNTAYSIPISSYIESCYTVFIDTYGNGFLSSEIKEYYEGTRYIQVLTFYINIPVSVFISSLIVFFIPPFIFKKGRKTIGMLIYNIGFVNSSLYNLTIKQYLLKFVTFYFLEFILSIFTFGIPLFISLTMMLVTKKKQNFNEYILNIQEVSTKDSSIYNDKTEIIVETNDSSNNVDFHLR